MNENEHTENELDGYQKARVDALELYHSFGKVRSPAFKNELIHFTSEGFNHLVYKTKKVQRPVQDQLQRFRLLALAKMLLELSTTFQEFEERLEGSGLVVKYWSFVAVFGGTRIKVVVREKATSKKEFYSVIPAWFTSYYRGIKLLSNSTLEDINS